MFSNNCWLHPSDDQCRLCPMHSIIGNFLICGETGEAVEHTAHYRIQIGEEYKYTGDLTTVDRMQSALSEIDIFPTVEVLCPVHGWQEMVSSNCAECIGEMEAKADMQIVGLREKDTLMDRVKKLVASGETSTIQQVYDLI